MRETKSPQLSSKFKEKYLITFECAGNLFYNISVHFK